MNLHSSQTKRLRAAVLAVWDPYEFTQLSNNKYVLKTYEGVWDPYEFTQLSNR